MENKTQILSISGMPVSGKSTTIKEIVKQLKNKGYTDENIHLVSSGHEFREYFNKIVEFISNLENDEKLKELAKDEHVKILFENQDFRDKLGKTIVKLKESKFDLNEFNIEIANNSKEFEDVRDVIDIIIDTEMSKLGKRILDENKSNEIWLIDSRLAFFNIPESFAVRLMSNENVAAKRLFSDSSRGKEDNKYADIEAAKKAIKSRENGEVERYKQKYGVNLQDEENYDLLIDTSYSDISEIAETIIKCSECYHNNKPFARKWASPKIFLPLQSERDTMYEGSEYNIDEMISIIKKEGYKVDEDIETIELKDRKYIIEGHHRNFAAAKTGKTLIPYTILESDKTTISDRFRKRAESIQPGWMRGHEWLIDKDFSYEEIYPGIYKELESNGIENR